MVVACVGDPTSGIDLDKHGPTVLSAADGLGRATAGLARVAGTIPVANHEAGDVFEAVTASAGAGTPGQGGVRPGRVPRSGVTLDPDQ